MPDDVPADFYIHNADLYAALVLPTAEPYRNTLAGVLAGVDPGAEAVIDVGAGVGTMLDLLAARFPNSPLVAVEPSAAMRAGLMTLVALRPDLRARVTVVPGRLGSVLPLLPASWGLVILLNTIGHLAVDERRHLWRHLAERLVPGGAAVVGLQHPPTPAFIPWTDFGEARVGTFSYRTEGCAEPAGPEEISWTMRWTVRSSTGAVLDSRQATTSWRTVSPEQLTAEAADAGLRPAAADQSWGLYVLVLA